MQHALPKLFSVGILSLFLFACGDDGDSPSQPVSTPQVSGVTVSVDPDNALSTVVTFDVLNAERARVVYAKPGAASLATPYYPVADGTARIVTLGLEPLTAYAHVVEVSGDQGNATSDSVSVITADLPDFLRDLVQFNITTGSGDPASGYFMTSLREPGFDPYNVVVDLTGRIVWYKTRGILGSYFQQSPNGTFVSFIGTTNGWSPSYGYYLEQLPDGREVARYAAPAPLYTDSHELLLEEGTSEYHIMSYDIRVMDFTELGGPSDAQVAGHQILRFGAGGQTEFMWNAWDHYDMSSWIVGRRPRDCTACDIDHPNSLSLDSDGHYLISLRNFSAVTKIDSRTGDIIWQLGGVSGDFSFMNDTFGGFSAQHYAHRLENGNILIYDNGGQHSPPETRVVEYELNTASMTATQVWEFRHAPPLYTSILGSAQRLANGNTFVGFGNAGFITEVDAGGNVVWEAEAFVDGKRAIRMYRCYRIGSLYEHQKL